MTGRRDDTVCPIVRRTIHWWYPAASATCAATLPIDHVDGPGTRIQRSASIRSSTVISASAAASRSTVELPRRASSPSAHPSSGSVVGALSHGPSRSRYRLRCRPRVRGSTSDGAKSSRTRRPPHPPPPVRTGPIPHGWHHPRRIAARPWTRTRTTPPSRRSSSGAGAVANVQPSRPERCSRAEPSIAHRVAVETLRSPREVLGHRRRGL